MQVLGALMDDPCTMNGSSYHIEAYDFERKVDRQIYGSIMNLFNKGASKITPLELDDYLSKYPEIYENYKINGGLVYLQDIEQFFNQLNIEYYYERFKKFSALRSLIESGFDVTEIYDYKNDDPTKQTKIEETFDNLELDEIFRYVGKKLNILEKDYTGKSSGGGPVSDNIRNTFTELQIAPEIGHPLQGKLYNSIVRGARKGKLYANSAGTSTGKAIPISTLIPTPTGLKTALEVKVGDELFDRQGKSTKVIGVFPQGRREMFEISFSDGRKAVCNDEHLWSYYITKKKGLKTTSLKEMMKLPIKTGRHFTIQVPKNECVEYSEKSLPIDPYVFGLALGDGSFRQQKSNKAFSFSSENEYLPNKICEIMGYDKTIRNSDKNFTWTFKKKQKRIYVEDFLKDCPEMINLYSDQKYIPEEYLLGSKEQRLALLNGILDTDGGIGKKDGSISITTISPKLKDNLTDLIRSLGFICSVYEDGRKHKYKNGECYVIKIQGTKEQKIDLFNLPRKKEMLVKYCSNGKRQELKKTVDVTSIKKLNEMCEMVCFLVDNDEHLFLMNDYIVTHNTRIMVGNACNLAYPYIYDRRKKEWLYRGNCQKVLYIATEQEQDEIHTLILAYLTGINEEKILYFDLTDEELLRCEQAMKIIEEYHENLFIETTSNPSIVSVQAIIRSYAMTENVDHIFYDYIFSSDDLLKEYRDLKLREDVVLRMFATALKDLANELKIYIETATQVSSEEDLSPGKIRDHKYIQGSKAIANKIDIGTITMRVTDEEIQMLSMLLEQNNYPTPTHVVDLYKARRSKNSRVRIWRVIDLGTCRVEDLFVTDQHFNPQDISINTYIKQDNIRSINEILEKDQDSEIEIESKEKDGILPW